MPETKIPIAVAYGDGIGPEIMAATLHVLEEAGAPLKSMSSRLGRSSTSRGYRPESSRSRGM